MYRGGGAQRGELWGRTAVGLKSFPQDMLSLVCE